MQIDVELYSEPAKAYIVTKFDYDTEYLDNMYFGRVFKPDLTEHNEKLSLGYRNIKINETVPEYFYVIVDIFLIKFTIYEYMWEDNKGIANYKSDKHYYAEKSDTFILIKTMLADKFTLDDDLIENIIKESQEIEF